MTNVKPPRETETRETDRDKERNTTRENGAASPPPPPTSFLEMLRLGEYEFGQGRCQIEMVVQKHHLRSLDIIHGGVLCSLLDTAIGVAAHSLAPPDTYVVTIQLSINFVRPAWEGERLITSANTLHAGQRTAVGQGEIRNADNVLVASATGTFMYIPHSSSTRGGIQKQANVPDRADPNRKS